MSQRKIAKHISEAVIDNLNGRSGYDHLWDQIDDDTRLEIFRGLEKDVADVLEEYYPNES